LRLGDQLPRVQGDGGAAHARVAALRMAAQLPRVPQEADRAAAAGGGGTRLMNLLARILGDASRTAAHHALPVRRYAGGETVEAHEEVAAETAVALVYNGTPHAVMMASPRDLEEFGIGFTVTENIVAARDEIRSVRARDLAEGI